ncbi:IS5 family transposase ISPsy19 [Pseudomonas savastanoi pv. phaseolicola]|uniref:IS5-like element ISPsy19 family transposase n=1 Tax=Pseudomonas savastanoi TaxID=29438 RepID=UPI00198164AB|nr:IS5-like element ISPsy19 family transposase [Pseudomonas savastanoi]MBN4176445.1 IS5 family transposase ISPsy19 [Pseudomonas savastanoi pv. phaseolicola]
MPKTGRPRSIAAEHYPVLVKLAHAQPYSSQAELALVFFAETGITAHPDTFAKALKMAGITRVKQRAKGSFQSPEPNKAYGYNETHRRQLPEQLYPSCLTDTEWALVADLFESQGGRGVPPLHSRRTLLEACCYVVRTGCSWRMLPRDFPHWDNVYKTFRRWSAQGKFEQMHDRLRAQWREREERADSPSAAILDSQSTRSSPQGGDSGYNAGKKVKGRKRSLIVDTLGLLLAVSISAASVQDRDAADDAVAYSKEKYPSLSTLFVDSAYAGKWAQRTHQLHAIDVQVIRGPNNRRTGQWHSEQGDLFSVEPVQTGFVVMPKRWVMERTHAWNERARRLIMHHDRLFAVSEAWVWLAEARILARRLTT